MSQIFSPYVHTPYSVGDGREFFKAKRRVRVCVVKSEMINHIILSYSKSNQPCEGILAGSRLYAVQISYSFTHALKESHTALNFLFFSFLSLSVGFFFSFQLRSFNFHKRNIIRTRK